MAKSMSRVSSLNKWRAINTRNFGDKIFVFLAGFCLCLCFAVLVFLLGSIFIQGAKALSLSFFFDKARDFGASGGIAYQILGSLLIVIIAALLVLPVAVGTAVYRNEYEKNERRKRLIDLILFSLNGIPSITFGLFGLIFFVNILGTGLSWFVGSIILAMMMMPVVTLTTTQTLQSLPRLYRENALALGLSKGKVIRSVVLPQSLHGIITGLFIALARAVGETAPIMFIATAFSGVTVPRGLFEPVSTLPTHILALAQQATNPDALQKAWGASLTLLLIVILFSSMAYLARYALRHLAVRQG